MQDRTPATGKAGRVRITPEGGGAAYYAVIEMADEATQEGTAWSKANVLTDATAALLGLTSAAVPDDAFETIAKMPKRHTYGSFVLNEDYVTYSTATFDFNVQCVIAYCDYSQILPPVETSTLISLGPASGAAVDYILVDNELQMKANSMGVMGGRTVKYIAFEAQGV